MKSHTLEEKKNILYNHKFAELCRITTGQYKEIAVQPKDFKVNFIYGKWTSFTKRNHHEKKRRNRRRLNNIISLYTSESLSCSVTEEK